jgi:hypothetical protein
VVDNAGDELLSDATRKNQRWRWMDLVTLDADDFRDCIHDESGQASSRDGLLIRSRVDLLKLSYETIYPFYLQQTSRPSD